MKFTIDRARWLRGDENPYLLRASDGKMCCLGFFLRSCGLSDDELRDHSEPQHPFEEGRPDEIPNAAAFLVESEEADEDEWGEPSFDYGPTDDASDLMTANDDPEVTEAERERRVARLFAKHGHEVDFVDACASPTGSEEREVKP